LETSTLILKPEETEETFGGFQDSGMTGKHTVILVEHHIER
jgi:hypothetical protein